MKPSKFLGKFNIFEFHNRQIFDKTAEVDDEESNRLVDIRRKGFKELDERFIDRENLILRINDNLQTINCLKKELNKKDKLIFDTKIETYKEILEMLK